MINVLSRTSSHMCMSNSKHVAIHGTIGFRFDCASEIPGTATHGWDWISYLHKHEQILPLRRVPMHRADNLLIIDETAVYKRRQERGYDNLKQRCKSRSVRLESQYERDALITQQAAPGPYGTLMYESLDGDTMERTLSPINVTAIDSVLKSLAIEVLQVVKDSRPS
jgi:hypothetical protein